MPKKTPVLVAALATNLKAVRLEKKLTQEQLAERAGISVAYVSLLERGGRCAPLVTVEALARGLQVDPFVLLARPAA